MTSPMGNWRSGPALEIMCFTRLQELDDTVTVYRGVRSERPGSIKAMSWTLSRETAQWFANRYGKAGTVYEAAIEKKHIHALFLGRNESEVIVDPKYLTDITPVQELRHGARPEAWPWRQTALLTNWHGCFRRSGRHRKKASGSVQTVSTAVRSTRKSRLWVSGIKRTRSCQGRLTTACFNGSGEILHSLMP